MAMMAMTTNSSIKVNPVGKLRQRILHRPEFRNATAGGAG
jgi:hypothetical protein